MRQTVVPYNLVAGWNFISTPKQPSDTAIATVLSAISSKSQHRMGMERIDPDLA
jgi:hypothetical protein